MRPAAEAKGIQLAYALDADVGPVMGDADRLQQVVWNLVANAIKFTPQGGRIEVRLQRDGTQVQVIVTDTGQGISPEFLPFVFDRFRQAEGSSTRTHGGLGLGLAIVRHLIELHGGSVFADSRGIGMGATFKLSIPLVGFYSPEPMSLNPPPPTVEDEQNILTPRKSDLLNGVRVLIVDDEQDVLKLCQVLIGRAGAEVRISSSAAEALSVLDHWLPDVLVSDISMPDEDGYQLMRQLRARKPGAGGQIPAVALTGYARSEDRLLALSAGYRMHVPKPIEPQELITVIASLAGRLRNQ
jgi:CheY-like chemotaxis protein